jgi:uncharacterized integral membrane protein
MKAPTRPPFKPFRYVAVLLVAFAVVFGVQNAKPVGVRFLFWAFEGSLGLLLLLAFLLGVLVGLFLVIPKRLSKKGLPR